MDIGKAFPSKYVKASDLKGDTIVTINTVKIEPVGQDKKMKAVLYFKNKEKGLILNKTNANMISKLTGSALTEDWKGHKVALFATETQFGADIVDCIRVKAAGNSQAAAPVRKAKAKPVVEEPDDPLPGGPDDEQIEVSEEDFDPDDDDSVPF